MKVCYKHSTHPKRFGQSFCHL